MVIFLNEKIEKEQYEDDVLVWGKFPYKFLQVNRFDKSNFFNMGSTPFYRKIYCLRDVYTMKFNIFL